jgi:hypothetical protein
MFMRFTYNNFKFRLLCVCVCVSVGGGGDRTGTTYLREQVEPGQHKMNSNVDMSCVYDLAVLPIECKACTME